jgi:uncharacterized protein
MSKKEISAGDFCWNELMTNDTGKAKEFYGELLGWECHDIDMPDMTYTIFKSGDKEIGGMLQTPEGQVNKIPPHWMSYIAVDDIQEMTDKAKALGAKIEVDVQKVNEVGLFSVLVDPTGAHIALWQSTLK